MSKPETSLAVQIDTVRGWLEQQTPELAKALPKGMDAVNFARIALTAVLHNNDLAKCSKQSFVLAIMEAAALGLAPDSQSGMCYLVPFGQTCQLIVGYRGLIQLAHRNPRISQVTAEAVYAKDHLEVALGISPKLVHVPVYFPARGELIGAYAWAKVSGGGRPFVYMPREEIEEHRARSRAKDSGPWRTDTAAMYKKTAVRQLCKFIPQSPQLMSALATEDDPEQERPLAPLTPGDTVEATLDAIATAGEGANAE